MDWLAEQVIQAFIDVGLDDFYIDDKRKSLAGRDRAEVVRYLNNLDDRVFNRLASNLGVAPTDLLIAARVMRNL